jgi:hypothetical protein
MGIEMTTDDHKFEHVSIEYEGGSLTLRFREYNQTIKLFKNLDAHGDHKVVVSSSGWFEMEQTIKRHEHRYYVMLDGGRFLNIERPTRDGEFNDECCIIKISNVEVD